LDADAGQLPEGVFPAAELSAAHWLEGGPEEGLSRESMAQGQGWNPAIAFRGAGEIFAPADEGAGAALALELARAAPRPLHEHALKEVKDERAFLWVQDASAIRAGGRPFLPGLPRDLAHRLIHVTARTAEDALFALEEGVRCRDLAFVIGEIAGNPRALDFTASRRLVLAAERHRVPLWLVRMDARRDLGAARMRWDVRSAASQPSRWNPQAPGLPGWRGELFRARGLRPGAWWIRPESAHADGGGDGEAILSARPVDRDAADQRSHAQSARAGDLVRAAVDRSLAAG
jgi:protein ImuA